MTKMNKIKVSFITTVIAVIFLALLMFLMRGTFVRSSKEELNECDKGNELYQYIEGCPDYECMCNMPDNQSLCDLVMEACRNQAYKLPNRKICVEKIIE